MVNFLKFCQLSISYEIYTCHSKICPEAKPKQNWKNVVADEKLFLKAWSIEWLPRLQ